MGAARDVTPSWRSAVVTGASGGLGAAFCEALARPGLHLALLGRDAARLDAAATRGRARGGGVSTGRLDVRDAAAMEAWLLAHDARYPVDLVIANAGIAGGAPEPGTAEPAEAARAVFDTNLGGMLNTVLPLLPGLMARGRGQIVLVSSLAAFAPLPEYPAYSGAKAALLAYGRALRDSLRGRGLAVTVACPGFVATPMGEGYRGRRPFEVSAAAAARRILDGAARGRGVVAFPRRLAVPARLGGAVPAGVRRWGMAQLARSAMTLSVPNSPQYSPVVIAEDTAYAWSDPDYMKTSVKNLGKT